MDTPSRASGTSAGASSTPSSTLSPPIGPGAGSGSVPARASGSAAVSPPRPERESGAPTAADPDPPPHGDEGPRAFDPIGEDVRRARACEACRGLKVRCEMPDEGSCRRCSKAGRRCVVTVRSRGGERQKKTDTRVAELEKKIDLLSATLHASRGPEHVATPPGGSQAQRAETRSETAPSPEASRAPNTMMNTLLTSWGVTDGAGFSGQQSSSPTGQKRKHSVTHDPHADDRASRPPNLRGSSPPNDAHSDIVERGLVTEERAEALFGKYNDLMAPHFPAVIFPPGSTATSLRASKPLLFLAIMAAATSDAAALQKTLVGEVMHAVADRVVCRGEKSLELVQALFVSVAWYWPPESFEELKFYQLAHMGIVMAIDLGLGRGGGGARPRHQIPAWGAAWGSSRVAKIDAESLECRRTWLAAYLLATNVSIGLRRLNLLPWSNFMRESVEVLETPGDAAPTDRYLCQLVRANRLGEKATTQFSLDDPVMNVNLADVRTQLSLKSLEKELERLKRDVPKELKQRLSL
ncbi:Zn(II)2Cys6 transcription factor [Candidatus Bathyarchaeota archaeon]|nr:Zn(II)2Cys6 transcription factor [Candidatus Bathyarchaeota archaeon]